MYFHARTNMQCSRSRPTRRWLLSLHLFFGLTLSVFLSTYVLLLALFSTWCVCVHCSRVCVRSPPHPSCSGQGAALVGPVEPVYGPGRPGPRARELHRGRLGRASPILRKRRAPTPRRNRLGVRHLFPSCDARQTAAFSKHRVSRKRKPPRFGIFLSSISFVWFSRVYVREGFAVLIFINGNADVSFFLFQVRARRTVRGFPRRPHSARRRGASGPAGPAARRVVGAGAAR